MSSENIVTIIVKYQLDRAGHATVVVEPQDIPVQEGCVIQFQRVGNMIGKMRVTFEKQHRDCFDNADNPSFPVNGEFHEGHRGVEVKKAKVPSEKARYDCELLDGEGKAVAQSQDGKGGGTVEPVKRG